MEHGHKFTKLKPANQQNLAILPQNYQPYNTYLFLKDETSKSGHCSVSIKEEYSTVTVLPIRLQTICELIVISKDLELASKSLLMKRTQKLELVHVCHF